MDEKIIKEMVRAKFEEQKKKVEFDNKCPHCGKKIKFNFQHTQHTAVDTELVEITKGE